MSKHIFYRSTILNHLHLVHLLPLQDSDILCLLHQHVAKTRWRSMLYLHWHILNPPSGFLIQELHIIWDHQRACSLLLSIIIFHRFWWVITPTWFNGSGSIEVDGGTFNNVLCVPTLSSKLLSVYEITHSGTDKIVDFTPDSVLIRDLRSRELVVVGNVDHASQLYEFSHFAPIEHAYDPISHPSRVD